MIVCYRLEHIPMVWDEVKPFIERALNRGSTWSLDEVHEGLLTGKCQLWTWQEPDIKAVMVTAIQVDTEPFCLLLTMAGTRMEAWMPQLSVVEDWARNNGCREMRIYGRIGWSRFGFDIIGHEGHIYDMRRIIT